LLALEASDAAFCDGPYGDDAGSTHENRRFTGEITGDTATEDLALADDIFDGFEFTFEDDEEARLFTFTDEPLARLELNVGRASRQASSFLPFNPRKQSDFFEISGGNHGGILEESLKIHKGCGEALPRSAFAHFARGRTDAGGLPAPTSAFRTLLWPF
jgi:hypothetical protein